MKFGKFTVIIAVLLMAILAIGAVSAESIDDKDVSIAAGGSDLDLQSIDDSAGDLSAADTTDDVASADDDENIGSAVLSDGDDNDDEDPYGTFVNKEEIITDSDNQDYNADAIVAKVILPPETDGSFSAFVNDEELFDINLYESESNLDYDDEGNLICYAYLKDLNLGYLSDEAEVEFSFFADGQKLEGYTKFATVHLTDSTIQFSSEDDPDIDPDDDYENIYLITDDTYSTYFNDDGTPKDILSDMGDYVLVIESLSNKNITISSGSHIKIEGKDHEEDGETVPGSMTGTITIGDGSGMAGSIIISNLEINAFNAAAININDFSTDITIENCRIGARGNSKQSESSILSVYGINALGFISGLYILDNEFRITGDASYSYGINLGSYGAYANPEDITIANNDISVIVEDSCAEAIYLDNPVGLLVENNTAFVSNTGDNCAYGIQVADSAYYVYMYAGYEGELTSACDILINNNYFEIESDFMIYGITVQDFGANGYDPDKITYEFYMPLCYQFDLNTTIVDNTVIANSKRGVVGIGGQTYNMTVINNDVTAIGTSAVNMTTGDALGNHTSALLVQYNAGSAADDYYVVVRDNRVTTNVLAEEINSESFRQYVTFENNTETPVIVINDETYSTYFNEDGTPKDALPAAGGYDLYIDVIHEKDIKITSGSDITITALTDYTEEEVIPLDEVLANIINGTIFIQGADDVVISGVTIFNENHNGIDIADGSDMISIVSNKIDIRSVPVEDNPYFSVYAINANGFITQLAISENEINVYGKAPYNYGIQLGSYGAEANPEDIFISENSIIVIVEGEKAIMGEAIYLDNPAGALIDGNEISVMTSGDVFAYGIQIADSAQYVYYAAGYEGNITSPRNVTISDNTLSIDGEYMVYAITFQSFGANGYDEDMEPYFMPLCYQFELNTKIVDNEVYAHSDRGVIGIGALAYNVTIEDNEVDVFGTSAEGIESADAFGNDTYALGVLFNAASADEDYYSFVINNYVRTDVTAEHINSESYREYVTFENNTLVKIKDGAFVIDESNYELYFNEDGTLKDESPLMDFIEDYGRANVVLGNLTNRKMTFDVPLDIGAYDEDCKLINSTISLVEGADVSRIQNLNMEFEGNTASTAIIYITNVDDVLVANNTITATNCAGMMMAIEVESGSEGCNNIFIFENDIDLYGKTNYLYGIDVFQTWQSEAKNSEIAIGMNNIYIEGGARMAEPIYVSNAETVGISENEVVAISPGCAYGIATDSLTEAEISNNNITAISTGKGMAYGITSTSSEDIDIVDNEISATGKGVVGIGLKDDDNVTIDGNSGDLTGYYYEDAETRDSIGKANAAILNKDNSSTNVNIGENNFVEDFPSEFVLIDDANYDQYFDESGHIKEGAIHEGAYVLLGNMIGKEMIFDIPVYITKQDDTKLVNSTIDLVEGADGSSISGLMMEFEGNNVSTSIISIVDVNTIDIYNNTIVATDCTGMMMAIEVSASEKDCSDIIILDNVINVSGTSNYLYGIDAYAAYWNGIYFNDLDILGNNITINGGAKMAEAVYVSGAKEALIQGNDIVSISPATPYAIATDNCVDVDIYRNNLVVNATSGSMAYALTSAFDNNVDIQDNNILAEGQGAVGVGLRKSSDVNIVGNTIQTNGDDFTNASTSNRLGQANAAILNKDSTDVAIGENTITENGPKLIDDTTYSQYFNNGGTVKEGSTIADEDTLFIGQLTNKDIVIYDIMVSIKGIEDNKLVNSTISLLEGADGSSIEGLNMEFTGDNETGSVGIIYARGVSEITIINNNIVVPDFVDKAGSQWGSSVYAIEIESGNDGCNFVEISGNNIEITGSARYLYGIDVFKSWGETNERNSVVYISNNNVTINGGTRMAEAIYVSESNDVSIKDNTISSLSLGAAYGISTDQLAGSEIKENSIKAGSLGNMAYGITSTTSGSDVEIEDNNVTAIGIGAVGVGLSGQDNVTVTGNNIEITGEDFTSIESADNLGTANAAILDKNGANTNLNIGENNLTENGKATDHAMTGDGTKDLQYIIDAAEAGSTVDLTGQYFNNVGTVTIDKDIAINGGKIVGAEGKTIFEIAPKSQNGPNEVNITGVEFAVNNANTIVKVTGENSTDGISIEVPTINIKGNTIEAANDNVVTESVTVLELDSERPILSPTNEIAVSGNTIAAGVDPFDFKVTTITSGSDTVIVPQNITTERKATEIIYSDMNTTAVSPLDPRTGEWFTWRLVDGDGKPLANTPMQIGFNGVIYDEKNGMVTDENGYAKLQINLGYKGDYTFAITYLGNDLYNASFVVAKIKVATQTGSLTVPNKSYAASAKTKSLTATFKTKSGKVVANKKISFTVNGKTYSAKTNDKGVATVNVSLNKKGTYSFTAKFAGDSTYTEMSKTAKLTIK